MGASGSSPPLALSSKASAALAFTPAFLKAPHDFGWVYEQSVERQRLSSKLSGGTAPMGAIAAGTPTSLTSAHASPPWASMASGPRHPARATGSLRIWGYAPYDYYDLGQKMQQGGVETYFGVQDEFLCLVARRSRQRSRGLIPTSSSIICSGGNSKVYQPARLCGHRPVASLLVRLPRQSRSSESLRRLVPIAGQQLRRRFLLPRPLQRYRPRRPELLCARTGPRLVHVVRTSDGRRRISLRRCEGLSSRGGGRCPVQRHGAWHRVLLRRRVHRVDIRYRWLGFGHPRPLGNLRLPVPERRW